MKSLTVTLPNHIADALAREAHAQSRTADDLVAEALERTFGDADWFDDLDPAERGAIEEGIADLEQGRSKPHNEAFGSLRTAETE